MKITINNKEYNVKEAHSEEEKERGLQGIENLEENEGMLFFFNPPEIVKFWMQNTSIPLDIVFINDEQEVIKVAKGKPNDETLISSDEEVAYVLEVNQDSKIKVGDELDFSDEKLPVMKVLAQDGSTQMELWGGERIFRRTFTKQLINLVKKSKELKNDEEKLNSLYKRIGRKMFKEIQAQNNRPNEYVKSPN